MFRNIGAVELLLILGLALIVFGPAKLPEIGKALGKAIGEFKSHANKITEDVKIDLEDDNK